MKIGDLARATGISVRTLHYYEELGLVRPARRSSQGHRLYGERELLRLQQILSLRALGLRLTEIAGLLARRDLSAVDMIERHMARLTAEIADRTRLLARLRTVRQHLRAGDRPTAEQLLRAIEETVMIDKPTIEQYFSKEQIEALTRRRRALDATALREEAEDWRRVIADVRAAKDRGLAATDPSLSPIAERWKTLLRRLGGDDPAVNASLARLYRGEPAIGVQYGLGGGVDRFVGEMLRANGWPPRDD